MNSPLFFLSPLPFCLIYYKIETTVYFHCQSDTPKVCYKWSILYILVQGHINIQLCLILSFLVALNISGIHVLDNVETSWFTMLMPSSFPYTSFVSAKPPLWPCVPLNSAVSPHTGYFLTASKLLLPGMYKCVCVCVCTLMHVFFFACVCAGTCPVRSANGRQGFYIIGDVLRLIGY